MQPYIGSEQPESPSLVAPPDRLGLADLRNLSLILLGWVLVLLLLPPQHEYPIIDDWIYAGSVRTMLQTGTFVMPPATQANLVGLTLWGAAWCKLLGFNFTILTYSTLFMSLICLFTFYAIARLVNVPPWGALLGTALLGFNPIFVHLSYSFMTDVPFLTLTLLACYCYMRGIQEHEPAARVPSLLWFAAGGLFSGWAFLIRQFGVLVPLAFLLYLLMLGLLEKKWRWLQMVATASLPMLIVGGWYLWSRDIPPTPAAIGASGRVSNFIFKELWGRVILARSLTILPLAALFSWGAIKIRRTRLWLIPLSMALVAWVMLGILLPPETYNQIYEPPFTAVIGSVSITLPIQLFTFGVWGNIVRIVGIDFFEYRQQPVWSSEAWWTLWALGMVLMVLLLAKMGDGLLDWLRERRHRIAPSPLVGFYLLGLMVFVASTALLGDLFDRYTLAFVPMWIMFVVRGSARWGKIAWGYSITTLVLISGFTLLAKADQIDHDNARWRAAQWLQVRSGALHGGFDWDNWVGARNDLYQITDLQDRDFRIEQSFPYFSRLAGFTRRYVIAESHFTVSPLSTPSPTLAPSP